jgi:hypothetical protein
MLCNPYLSVFVFFLNFLLYSSVFSILSFLFRHVFSYWFYFVLSLLFFPSDLLSVFDFFSLLRFIFWLCLFLPSFLRPFSVLISFLCLLLWIFLYFRISLTSHSISASLFDVSFYYLSLFLFLLSFLLFFPLHICCLYTCPLLLCSLSAFCHLYIYHIRKCIRAHMDGRAGGRALNDNSVFRSVWVMGYVTIL